MGTKLGRSQLHVKSVGGFSRARTAGTSLLSRLDAAETLHLPCLVGQVWFPGATHRAIQRCPTVWRTSWRTANLIRFGTIRGEQSRNQVGTTEPAAMGPCAPSEAVLHSSGFVVTSEHAVTSGCVKSRSLCGISWFRHISCTPRMVSTFGRHASLHKLAISELNRCP